MRRLASAIAILATVAVLAAAAVAWWGYDRFMRPGPLSEDRIVIIPSGAGLPEIAQQLVAAGVIDQALVFTIGVRVAGDPTALRAGEFEFPAGVSQRGAMQVLISGQPVHRRFTVAEGLYTVEVLAIVADVEGLDGGLTASPGEGELLPDTYYFSLGDSRDEVIERMRQAMRDTLDELWEGRAADLPIASPAEALVLASIIEKETGLPEERPRVAAVFVNRLSRGMRLQSDPTVVYGITMGEGPLGRQLLLADLDQPTPYNTYQTDGLPPGPIANPGRAAIEAALHPAETNDLYFVADGSGGHAFAETLEQHNQNVARWRQIQQQD